ncbi:MULTISPECIES: TlpA family protein disulfide reductase [Kocuria]|uniref:Thiol-disulfide isomerase or thioredoxin n=1 Tax=Kocuria marina subsp. indica TaxID=1049583 RepID=A0A1X7DJU1_9MICC|nr:MULTISPECIES: TlpA disulfide reductase family protein [Kocuria]MDT0119020.1 TlpA disulfide reductase family protein [Kocuria sp. PD6]OXS82046.1 thiol-disulfide isomerase [Kocuria indica]RLP57402.1 TlpA family protein disulfide reductase [Kocuria indica]SMF16522.1 Thiol-disulfide isomerase or thioredoxin [Kocuria indica]
MTSRPTPCAAPSRRRVLSLAGLGVLGLALTGCAEEDSLAQQANSGDQKGYIAGDGTVSEYPAGERGEPVQFTGTLFDGTELSAEDLRGRPALLNFWYAGCAPCRVEAPDLKELAQRFDGQAAFYGVNLRDERPTAEAFERTFEIPYPSFRDKDGGVLMALSAYVPSQAVPTTLVLDAEGRVAARILGIADRSVLETLLEDTVAEAA